MGELWQYLKALGRWKKAVVWQPWAEKGWTLHQAHDGKGKGGHMRGMATARNGLSH